MVDVALQALGAVMTPSFLFFLAAGVVVGLIIGIIPGLGGVVGMSIIIPFIFGMDTLDGLALLVGALAVTSTSDTFPAVLIGVPGSAGAQATIMDGYPMARQGRAKEALGAAFTASALGGVFGAFALLAILGFARPLLLAMASPELFMLTILGLSLVGVLSRKAPALGLLSAFLGAGLGLIGLAAMDGQPRFTGGTFYLVDGLPIAIVALGLFGLPEIINMLAKGTAIVNEGRLEGSALAGARQTFRHPWLVFRCSVLGMALGAVPGLGGAVVDWLLYGVAQQTYKDGHKFGTGDIRGVIAPESGMNAKEGGAFLPTLVFGIPGSAQMAVLIGGLTFIGINVGPQMLTTELSFTVSIAWALALANVLGTALCFLFIAPIARMTLIRASRLMPFIMVILAMAAFQASARIGDLVVLVALGFLGWLMNYIDMPRPPMLIGFVLTASSERYLHLTLNIYRDGAWLTRPSVISLAVLTILLTVAIPAVRGRKERRADDRQPVP